MGFDLKDGGLHIVLSKDVPQLIRDKIKGWWKVSWRATGWTQDDMAAFVLHPGGQKLLLFIEEELGLPRAMTQYSWDVLRDYGNLSSASVLYVLQEWMTKGKMCGRRIRPADGVRARIQRGDDAAPVDVSRIAYVWFCWSWWEPAASLSWVFREGTRKALSQMARRAFPNRDFQWMVFVHAVVLIGAGLEVIFLRRPLIPALAISMGILCFALQHAALVGNPDAAFALERANHEFCATWRSFQWTLSLDSASKLCSGVCGANCDTADLQRMDLRVGRRSRKRMGFVFPHRS